MSQRALFLHGFAGGPSSFVATCSALGSTWQCHCPVLPGHEPDVEPRTELTFEQAIANFATHLREVLEPSCWPVHLVGYSLGARTALGLLSHRPEAFLSATLVGVHPGLTVERERRARAKSDQAWIDLLQTDGIEGFAAAWEAQPLFASQRALDPNTLRAHRLERRRLNARGLAWSLRTFGLASMPSYWALLRDPPVPTHLIVGGLDGKFRRIAERVTAENPSIAFTTIPGAGHHPALEQPAALAKAFIEGVRV